MPEGVGQVPEDNAGARRVEPYWTPFRLELRAWFERNAPSLGELYKGAVCLMFGAPLAGRVRFVTHAMREIGNRLPEVMAGRKSGPNLQYKDRIDRLIEVWSAIGLPTDGSISGTIQPEAPGVPASPEVSIDRRVFDAIAGLVKDHVLTREKPEEAALRLFQAAAPENQQSRDALKPVIQQWVRILRWAVGKAHDSGRVDADCSLEELEHQFELFETTLGALVRGYFKTADELDEILEDANS